MMMRHLYAGAPDVIGRAGVVLEALLEDETHSMTLFDVLKAHCDRGCVDPRDKVFGLRACVKPSQRQRIVVDYSLTRREVFRAVRQNVHRVNMDSIEETILTKLGFCMGLDDHDIMEDIFTGQGGGATFHR
jgi:hypothetical protein